MCMCMHMHNMCMCMHMYVHVTCNMHMLHVRVHACMHCICPPSPLLPPVHPSTLQAAADANITLRQMQAETTAYRTIQVGRLH